MSRGYMQWVQWILHSMLISVLVPTLLCGNAQFPQQILFTNECRFTRDIVLNSQNSHVWDDENPHAQHDHGFQQHFDVNMWAGIVDGRLIGPYLLPTCLMGNTFYLPARNIGQISGRCVTGR